MIKNNSNKIKPESVQSIIEWQDKLLSHYNDSELTIEEIKPKIDKSFYKFIQPVQETKKLNQYEIKELIENKMSLIGGGTQQQRKDTINQVFKRLEKENNITEGLINSITFNNFNSNKTSNRIINQYYND